MCVIIIREAGKKIDSDILRDCAKANPDGVGFAWPSHGKVKIAKGLWKLRQIVEFEKQTRHKQTLIHFRWTTHGGTSRENCHPFAVGGGGAMCHNGILPLSPKNPAHSDTRDFAAGLRDWSQDDIRETASAIENWHGQSNRLAFLYPDASVITTGSWDNYDGHRFSNLNWLWDYSCFDCYKSKKEPKPLPTMKLCEFCADSEGYEFGQNGRLCVNCATRFELL